jgi:hypothetical protein
MTALIAADPDGGGPAESQLEKPLSLAGRDGVVAAVNANAFSPVPRLKEGERPRWTEHLPVDILGWARSERREASQPQMALMSFWVDRNGRGHVGGIDAPVATRAAVAGFGRLLASGEIDRAGDKPLHPRTALGLDRDGSMLWLVVVDGRQSGYSEGMTLDELAALMKEIGCWDAINLDGGGSSIMLVAKEGKSLSIMNRPSDANTRPVPVMLGVRKAH